MVIFHIGGGGGGGGGRERDRGNDRDRSVMDRLGPQASSSGYGNTYGLSSQFLESLGIDGPLHTRVFVANVSLEKIIFKNLSPIRPRLHHSYGLVESLRGRASLSVKRSPLC